MSETSRNSDIRSRAPRRGQGSSAKWWGIAVAILVVATAAWTLQSYLASGPDTGAAPPPPAKVTVSKPLARDLETRIGFLGQFSATELVELRAQVGGELTGKFFKDGDVVHKGDLLFTIDPRPYDIKLAQANASLATASARLSLAGGELTRAQTLKRADAGTTQNVEQRTADQRSAAAAVDNAKAQIRDAQFDLEHCRVVAPFTGRIGAHLVSVSNLVAGSRTASGSSTLLATLVSLAPIYMNFDMSEADYLAFSRSHAKQTEALADKVEIELGDETEFRAQGTLDFVDNVLDRSSGTLHARATVPNADLLLTAGEFARVRLALGAPVPTLLVPDAAVIPDQSEHMIMTVGPDGKVVPKRVEVGEMRGGLRVIRTGLLPTDAVVIDGVPFAAPGSKVDAQDGTIRFLSTQGKD